MTMAASAVCKQKYFVLPENRIARTKTAFLLLLLFFVQGKDVNPFSALLNDQTLSCSELGWALTNESPPTKPSSPTPSPLVPPDLIQTKTNPAHCKTDLEVRRHQLCLVLWSKITVDLCSVSFFNGQKKPQNILFCF